MSATPAGRPMERDVLSRMEPIEPLQPGPRRRLWTPWLVLGVTLLLTGLAAYFLDHADRLQESYWVQQTARRTSDAIQSRLDTYIALLRATSGLFAAQSDVTRDNFRDFVKRLGLSENYPGIQGIGFSRIVKPSEREGVEVQARESGSPDFKIWTNENVPAERDEYHTILYLEPSDSSEIGRRNRAAIGFDMHTNPIRRAAMDEARQSRHAAASGPVLLKQETDGPKQLGFLIYLPVYRFGTPLDSERRQTDSISGFAYAPFRINDLLSNVHGVRSGRPVDFTIHVEGRDQRRELLYQSSPDVHEEEKGSVHTTIKVAGKDWMLTFSPGQAMTNRNVAPTATVIAGIGLSLLLFLVTRSEIQARDSAQRNADAAERASHELLRSEQALSESEERFRLAAQSASDLIYEWDLHSGEVRWFGDVDKALGWTAGEFPHTRAGWEQAVHPDDRPRVLAAVERQLRDGGAFEAEYRVLRSDGGVRYWLDRATILHNPIDQPARRVGATADVTERRLAEQALRASEERFRQLSESGVLSIAFFDVDGRFIDANDAFLRMLGYTREELEAGELRWDRLTPPEWIPRTLEAVREVKANRRCRPYEKEYIRRDGTRLWVLIGSAMLGSSETDGVSFVIDVSDRKRAERLLQRYADLFAHAELGLLLLSAEGDRIEAANPAIARMHGYTAQELTGAPLATLFADDYRMEWPSHVRFADDRGHHTFGAINQRKDKSQFPTELNLTAVKGPDGRAQYHILNVNDVTERERTEAELRYQLDLMNTITTNAAEALFLLDSAGRITFANPAGEELFGGTQQELLGTALSELLLPSDGQPPSDALNISRAVRGYEGTFHRKDGSAAPVSCSNAPIYEGERLVASVAVAHDISQRRANEQEREQLLEAERAARTDAEAARADAELANRSKDEFLATLSHELRTPLNAIMGWSQLLRTGHADPEDVTLGLETIERNAKLQVKLVEDLLDMSRIISGRLRLEMRPVQLPAVVTAALETCRPAAEAKQIQFIPVLDNHVGVVAGDPDRLQQVAWNLISNAIKFTPRGGRVDVSLQQTGEQVEIVVSDSGEGIAPDFLPRVFDRLRQADSSTTRRHGGLGLGLAIVRHLVELHGGEVRASSAGLGKGASFTVRLPIANSIAAAPPEESHFDDAEPSAEPTTPAEPPSLAGLRLLAVDDEADARELIAHVLRERGAEVAVVSSAAEAVERVERDPPDVLLSDIGMPEEDGCQMIRRIRALESERARNVPAIAVTAYARQQDRDRALESGFQLHLVKPLDTTRLAVAVAELSKGIIRTST